MSLLLKAPAAESPSAATPPANTANAPIATDESKVDLTQVSLEQLMFEYKVQSVYGASKREQSVAEAPSSITIIDADEIKKYGWRNLSEILKSVRDFYVTYDRNYSYLGSRGFSQPGDWLSKFLVLVDGHRVNENVFDGVLIGNDFILDVDNIARVEIIRGPGSSIYGDNAFFGVINVITKTGRDYDGAEVSGSAGSFDTYTARVNYGKKFKNGAEVMLSGTYLKSEGQDSLYYPEFNTPSNNVNNGVTRNSDGELAYQVFGHASYKDFSLEGAYNWREKTVPTASYGTIFDDPREKTVDSRAFLELKYHHNFEDDWDLTGRVYYDYYHYYGHYPLSYPADPVDPITYPADPNVMYKDYALGNFWGTDWQVNKKLFGRHTLSLGAEYRDNFQQDQGNSDDYVVPTIYSVNKDSRNYAFYGQAEVFLMTNLILDAGVRYDNYSTFGDTVNPRLALIYSPFEMTNLKLLYGTAFRAPNAYELYYAGFYNKANLDLKPEKIQTYELTLEQGLTRNLSFIASGFYYEINDLIRQETDPADGLLVYRNLDRTDAYGAEFEIDAHFPNGLRGRASYSYQHAEDADTHVELSNSPEHLAKFNLIVPLWKDKLFSGFEVQYTSDLSSFQGTTVDEFWVANLTLFSQNIVKNLEVSGSIYNLFDKTYYNTGAGEHIQSQIQQDGRTFRVKLTYRF